MARKNVDGKLATGVSALKKLLGAETPDVDQIGLKYRNALHFAGSQAALAGLLGASAWGKMQQILHPQASKPNAA